MSCHRWDTGTEPWSAGCPPCSASLAGLSLAWQPGSPADQLLGELYRGKFPETMYFKDKQLKTFEELFAVESEK